MQELHKGVSKFLKIIVIGFEVIGLNIGHHRQHRLQVEERGIRLIGLSNQEATGTQTGIGTSTI